MPVVVREKRSTIQQFKPWVNDLLPSAQGERIWQVLVHENIFWREIFSCPRNSYF